MKRAANIAILGAPMDLGAGRRGVDMGPSAIRVAQLHDRLTALGYQVSDLGNVEVVQRESEGEGSATARYLSQIAASCRTLANMVEDAAREGQVPLVLGGDHSLSIGSISGMANSLRAEQRKLGVLWVDAHADMNTPETTPSGNVHGMPLACLVGLGPPELVHLCGFAPKVEPHNVAIVGLRSVDRQERETLRRMGVRTFTMRDIDERGMATVMEEALEAVRNGTDALHLSFDMDSLDPDEAPGVGTPVRGGLTYREAHLAMEMICDAQCLRSLEVVEVNPVMDVSNRTAELAVELACSALGKRIL